VDSSGSIRFRGGSKEKFITPDSTVSSSTKQTCVTFFQQVYHDILCFQGLSSKDKLQLELAKIFGVPVENVDVFTVGNSPELSDANVFDVRYSVHNSPYYKPEKLDGLLAEKSNIVS